MSIRNTKSKHFPDASFLFHEMPSQSSLHFQHQPGSTAVWQTKSNSPIDMSHQIPPFFFVSCTPQRKLIVVDPKKTLPLPNGISKDLSSLSYLGMNSPLVNNMPHPHISKEESNSGQKKNSSTLHLIGQDQAQEVENIKQKSHNDFQPAKAISRATKVKKQEGIASYTRRHYTEEENSKLKSLVELYGEKSWKKISEQMPCRDRKQLRDHYMSFLKIEADTGKFSPEEDRVLLLQVQKLGRSFQQVSKFFPNRTTVMLKNRYNSLIRHAGEYSKEEITIDFLVEKGKKSKKNQFFYRNPIIYEEAKIQKQVLVEQLKLLSFLLIFTFD
eukprot:TRINITY_DN112_c0_g1_i1.p1 TRINITY_DN112_c0_g1~~TRINITY_DN112_c0_g1_i1.p1  ORF type:complete len:328 (-),score=29.70 TRINITY_DN112_c0_g1_i1:32-1015(-)